MRGYKHDIQNIKIKNMQNGKIEVVWKLIPQFQVPTVYSWWTPCHPAPHDTNLRHPGGVQLLSASEVCQHHTVPDSIPTQHTGRPALHCHPVLFRRLVLVSRNVIHTVNSELV